MHIDWISATVETPPELWPGYESGRTLKIGPDGEVVENRVSATQVEDDDPSSARTIRVWTPTPGSLYLSGNPVKLLQGHNLWGPLDPWGLFLEGGVWVRSRVGLFPGPETWEACAFRPPRYTRLDITRSYRFATDQEASSYIRHVVGNARSRHGQATLYGDGTAYFGQHSRRWTLKVYAKRQEMLHEMRRQRKHDRHYPDDLLSWAQGIVRFELTLRGLELKGLPPGTDLHDTHTLATLWHRYYRAIQFNENAAMSHTRPDLVEQTLPPRLRGVLALWRQGDDLRAIYPTRTFYRHRQDILKASGIDIAVPPSTEHHQDQEVHSELDPSGWDPEPLKAYSVQPREDLKHQYPLSYT